MAIRQLNGKIDVVKAARMRIVNLFSNKLPVYLSFSGGKDSLCLAHLTLELIRERKIDPKQLTVYFLDEEAIYPCIEKTVHEWRRKFLLAGAKFVWWCIECKHYNCFNNLQNDESFVCWDSRKEAVWIRRPPSFAVRSHPLLVAREDTYQKFFAKLLIDGICLIGVRASESLQRRSNFAKMRKQHYSLNGNYQSFPIYDWENKDVWLYLKNNKVDVPDIYVYLWQAGMTRNQLRVSQFFSIDTARSLVSMNEYYPGLMERIVRREPNAYLAALYWDSEMFGRSSRKRTVLETDEAPKDYEALLKEVFSNLTKHFHSARALKTAVYYSRLYLKFKQTMTPDLMQRMYESLMAGDPKLRTYRALYVKCATNVADFGREAEARRRGQKP